MKKEHRILFVFVACAVFLLGGAVSSLAKKTIDLKFSYWTPPHALPAKAGFEPWAKAIEEKSNGKVKITFYPAEALGHAPDHYPMVLKGVADIVWIDPNHTPGVFPLADIMSAPFLFPNSEICSTVMWRIYKKYLFDSTFNKVKVLFVFNVGLNEFHSTKSVKSMEDFKGLKVASDSKMHSNIYKALGASPVFMNMPDIYTGLERGMIDGRFQNWEGAFVWKIAEVTKYRMRNLKINTMPNVVMMNLDKWNSLPEDVKTLIESESGEKISRQIGIAFDKVEAEYEKSILENDKKLNNPPAYTSTDEDRQKMIKAVQPVIDKWVKKNEKKGYPAKAMLDDIRNMVKDFK
ncbi:MAG: TRAP transporter substrate-binding protein [Desulfobacteraceae bacterium]|jgi:TRAP-type C4-dicarboxylate transport system substrate-binding protein